MLRFVHPSIIDLYLVSLEQIRISNITDEADGVIDLIIALAHELNNKHNYALNAVGSEQGVANQLIMFGSSGGSA